MKSHKAFGGIYGLAFIGAAIYFIQHSNFILDRRVGFSESTGLAGSSHIQIT